MRHSEKIFSSQEGTIRDKVRATSRLKTLEIILTMIILLRGQYE